VRGSLESYFTQVVANDPEPGRRKTLAWRLSCFDAGLECVRYVEKHYFAIQGKRVLDIGCAWGGHAVAFASKGAQVFASDINDHEFPWLRRFSNTHDLDLHILRGNCVGLPFNDLTFDVIIALELVEHIDSVEPFAGEVARVLRPGGICLISTPPRFRSLLWGEPHYGIRGLTILPLAWQRFVATQVLGRSHPYPITRQYTVASKVIRPFASEGLKGAPVLRGRLCRYLSNYPLMLRAAQEVLWSFVVVVKPAVPCGGLGS